MNTEADIGLSVVIPCYNEAEVLPLLKTRLLSCMGGLGITWEVILVDDGSRDGTFEQLTALNHEDSRFKVISFSRNFGHQPAVFAGLAYASGAAVAVMDADLQDPPEILGACLEKLRQGYDVVYAVRRKRKEAPLKRAAYALFYRLLKSMSDTEIPLDSGDFCVMDRDVVEEVISMPERNLFLRGMRAWTGFRQTGLEYERNARAAGGTKYSFKRLVRLASDGIFAFSIFPLRITIYFGFSTLVLSTGVTLFILAWRIFGFKFMGHTPAELPGWTAIAIGLLFFTGVQILILGIMGEYIGRIYNEVKRRPRWIVRKVLGLKSPPTKLG